MDVMDVMDERVSKVRYRLWIRGRGPDELKLASMDGRPGKATRRTVWDARLIAPPSRRTSQARKLSPVQSVYGLQAPM
ncbi:hypothetical protein UVI_02002160 [Ustilaginoidea virens]|uniref:Uncharacterized protein n=1 Tax=Ustilaginoidea virens TaxID=1159556 RepID=A0A1B5L2H2_USTVR|nr:hypothetical protein UVI_02002160 [Ustilaginoidea virens]